MEAAHCTQHVNPSGPQLPSLSALYPDQYENLTSHVIILEYRQVGHQYVSVVFHSPGILADSKNTSGTNQALGKGGGVQGQLNVAIADRANGKPRPFSAKKKLDQI